MKQLSNIQIFNNGQGFVDGELIFHNERIVQVNKFSADSTSKKYLIPGLVDLQIYGTGGKLFSAEPTIENLIYIEDELLKQGCTTFFICLATNTPEVFQQCIEVVKQHRPIARNCMGLHLEGPYINPKKRGAHVEAFVRKANLEEVKQLLEFADGCVKMITLAPELQDDDVIDYLLSQQIILSLGHSDANFEQATRAFDGGVQTTTHLFNAMSPLNHRQPGVPTAVFNHPTAMASIIADGLHVDFELVKLAHKIMEERLFLITDAVTDCNIGPYQHQAVDGKFILPNGTLSGSALTMLQALQNCVNFCNVSLKNAINMASLYPAQLIGKETAIGSIYTGAYADFLVLDEHLSLEQVYFRGQEIISPTNEKN